MTTETIIGFDVGGSKIAVVEGDYQAKIYQRSAIPDHAGKPFEQTFAAMALAAEQLRDQAERDRRSVRAISVSIGGPLDIERGIIKSPPNLPGWDNIPLKDRLAERLGLPVYVEHDGNAGALAEFLFGAGIGQQNVLFLTMGTGLGAGIILNGQIYRGTTDTAGEVGFIHITDDGPVAYGKAGTWEGVCSGAGLIKLAHLRYPGRWPESITTRDLIGAALAGETEAVALVHEMGEWLGQGCAILVNTLNPQRIIVGTLGTVFGDLLLDPARRMLAEYGLPISAAACQIVPSALGDSLGDTAALIAAIDARRGGREAASGQVSGLREGFAVRQRVIETLLPTIAESAEAIIQALKAGHKLLVFGNGGSAAEAQHFVGELVGRYKAERDPLPAITLSADSSVVTCIGNDYSYAEVFARQIRALAQPGDVAVGLTTSGRSANVLRGFEAARERGAITIALTGQNGVQGGVLSSPVDYLVAIPSATTRSIQEEHLAIIHTWCDAIDAEFTES
ncbi:MAG TPA: ROK family protein [Phototrophicaceae bacterium]|nr:ROK family protein [Phototrophicaceae bacterium]